MRPFPLAHPVAIAAVATLALNDHVLKHAYPGFLTGKLSDVAGMIFFPLLLACFHRRGLAIACIATAIVFSLVKTMPWANDAYRVTWALMQWPVRMLVAWSQHRPTPGLARVVLVRDPSDLLAVPGTWKAVACGSDQTAALDPNGVIFAWGANTRAQMGQLPGLSGDTNCQFFGQVGVCHPTPIKVTLPAQ